MLTDEIIAIARKKMDLEVHRKDDELDRYTKSVIAEAAAHGHLRSSRPILIVDEACAEAMQALGERAWAILYRCLETTGIAYSDGLGADLKNVMQTLVPDAAGSLGRRPAELAAKSGLNNLSLHGLDTVTKARHAVLAHTDSEIDLFMISLREAAKKPDYQPQAVFNITNSSVGAVQSGQGATSTVTMSTTIDADAHELIDALGKLRSLVSASDAVAPDQKVELVELIDDSAEQAKKAKPNKMKIGASIDAVSGALKSLTGLASNVPQAIQAVHDIWSRIG